MKIIADTNTFLAVALNEPEKKEIIELTAGHDLIAPEILPFEIGNALSALVKRNKLTQGEAFLAWKNCLTIPVDLRAIDIKNALAVAIKNNIYAYDAYFIECATNLRCSLLTLDRQLQSVCRDLGIKIVEF
jgi:predicted nucleic acid-binding protein